MTRRLMLVATLSVALSGASALAQVTPATGRSAVLKGMVLDENGIPLPEAQVALRETSFKTTTDRNGSFAFSAVPSGQQVVILRRLGFRAASYALNLAAGETTLVAFAMAVSAQALDTVVVAEKTDDRSAKLMDFDRRRQSGYGTFITQADIEKRAPLDVSDLLRRVPSIRIVDSLGVPLAVSRRGVRQDRRRNVGTAPCILRVAVDGVVTPSDYSINGHVSPKDIAGIEVYAGPATVPPQFMSLRSETSCGLILIWTKDGSAYGNPD